jgi:hypothetical protein
MKESKNCSESNTTTLDIMTDGGRALELAVLI